MLEKVVTMLRSCDIVDHVQHTQDVTVCQGMCHSKDTSSSGRSSSGVRTSSIGLISSSSRGLLNGSNGSSRLSTSGASLSITSLVQSATSSSSHLVARRVGTVEGGAT